MQSMSFLSFRRWIPDRSDSVEVPVHWTRQTQNGIHELQRGLVLLGGGRGRGAFRHRCHPHDRSRHLAPEVDISARPWGG